jgi:hypothetical protein
MRMLTRVLLTLLLAQILLPASAARQDAPGLVIAGHVFDQSGRPFAGAAVYAIREGQPPGKIFSGRSGAGGEFVVRVREPGRYAVLANKSNHSWDEGYMPQNIPFFRYPGATADVTVAAGGALHGVQLRLAPRNGVVAGRIVDAATGLPVQAVRFKRCQVDHPTICNGGSSRVERGAFYLAAPHVPFTMKIEADDYEDWFAPDGVSEGAILSVPSGERLTLEVALRRRAEASAKAIDESEKQAGVHLPAPAQVSPADGATFDHFPRRTRLEWSPVEGAASYRVEVDFCEGREDRRHDCFNPSPFTNSKLAPPSARLQGTTYEFDFVGAQPGRWRVWAVDAEGREGFKSPWRRFVYQR